MTGKWLLNNLKHKIEYKWYALYVRSRTERKVTERLEARSIEVYCPLQTVVKQWSDRRKKVEEPLFKSYLFVRIIPEQRLDVLQTSGVVGFVNWLGKPAMIPDSDISAIREFLQQYEHICVSAYDRYSAGDEVRVSFGPLNGSHGRVVRQKKHKVTLRIDQLGMDLIAELPKSHLEPVL